MDNNKVLFSDANRIGCTFLRIHPFQTTGEKWKMLHEKHPSERQNVRLFYSQVPLFIHNIRFFLNILPSFRRSIKQTSFSFLTQQKQKRLSIEQNWKSIFAPYLSCNVGWYNREQQLLLVFLFALQLHPGRDALLSPLESQLVRGSVHAIEIDSKDVSTND